MRFWNSIGGWYGALMMPLAVGSVTGCGWSVLCAALLTAVKVGAYAADRVEVVRAWRASEEPTAD